MLHYMPSPYPSPFELVLQQSKSLSFPQSDQHYCVVNLPTVLNDGMRPSKYSRWRYAAEGAYCGCICIVLNRHTLWHLEAETYVTSEPCLNPSKTTLSVSRTKSARTR